MKAIETNLMYAKDSATSCGTSLEKKLKSYVREKFNCAIIDGRLINIVLEDIQQKAKELLASNPKCKAVRIELEDDTHRMAGVTPKLYWILANGQTILTIEKAECAYELS